MAKSETSVPRKRGGLSVHVRGHFLLFDKRSARLYDTSTGVRLLLIAVVVEALRLVVVRWLHPALPLLILVVFLLAFALLLVRFAAPTEVFADRTISVAQVDSGREILFCSTPGDREHRFSIRFREPTAADLGSAFGTDHGVEPLYPYLFFGFYQEVIYRGILQSELVRRWGTFIGILIANTLYTFGPLHWNYFLSSKRGRNPDVLIDLRDRSFFWHPVQKIRKSLDGSGHPRHW